MSTQSPAEKTPVPAQSTGTRRVIALALVLAIAVIAVLYLFVTSRGGNNEIIIGTNSFSSAPTTAADINAGQIIDTLKNPKAELRAGYLYKVAVTDMSREGTEGVTRIGGKTTLVRGSIKGDVAIIRVTSVSKTIARAELIELLEKGKPQATLSPIKDVSQVIDSAVKTVANPDQGKVYKGTVEGVGSKGDGIVRVDGKIVFVPGAEKGDVISFRIVETRDKYNKGKLVAKENPDGKTAENSADDVTVGREYEVTISEKDRKQPDKNGVTRISGLVVFIPGTQPGDKVRIRITDRGPRYARAIVLERL